MTFALWHWVRLAGVDAGASYQMSVVPCIPGSASVSELFAPAI